MDRKSKTSDEKFDFREQIPNYSDEEILKILKMRKHYQKEAADLAIRKAIERGLIHSEQDLLSDEFREKEYGFSLFPNIERVKNRKKIRKSIARGLLIAGVIPVVWGIIKIMEDTFAEGIILVVLGGTWMFASFRLMHKFSDRMNNLLFVLLAGAFAYALKLILDIKGLRIMDFAVPVVLFLFIAYGLIYMRKLNR